MRSYSRLSGPYRRSLPFPTPVLNNMKTRQNSSSSSIGTSRLHRQHHSGFTGPPANHHRLNSPARTQDSRTLKREQTGAKALRVDADTPIKTRAAIQPIEESAARGTVGLSQCIARAASLAPWFKVGGHAFRNIEQLFVISFWHLNLL